MLDQEPTGSLDGFTSLTTDDPYRDVSSEVSFDSPRTPNEDRPTLVILSLHVQSDGNDAMVGIDVDGVEIGRTGVNVNSGGLTSTPTNITKEAATIVVPPGSSFAVTNKSDPTGSNAITSVVELTL